MLNETVVSSASGVFSAGTRLRCVASVFCVWVLLPRTAPGWTLVVLATSRAAWAMPLYVKTPRPRSKTHAAGTTMRSAQ